MTDRRTVLAVVIGLAVTVLVGVVGIVLLASMDKPTPDVLGYVVTTGIGALGAVLASTRTAPEDPQPVVVANRAAEPVPTVEVPEPTVEAPDPAKAAVRKRPAPRKEV